MKKHPKWFVIYNQVIPWDVAVFIGTTPEFITKTLKTKFKKTLDSEEIAALQITTQKARTVVTKHGGVIVWLSYFEWSPSAIALLSHEIYHVAYLILDRMGVEPCEKSDEIYAYLIEHLTREALRKLS